MQIIKYSNTNQTLNVYSPLIRQAPIVLLIHGGGFVAFNNTRVEPIAQQLAEIGCVVVTPNYRKLEPNIYKDPWVSVPSQKNILGLWHPDMPMSN